MNDVEAMKRRLRGKTTVTAPGCWVFKRPNLAGGYGQIYWRNFRWPTHRLAYWLWKGDPEGKLVCHSCDNPPCCNPDHLWLGDHKANTQDIITKGRHVRQAINHCRRGHLYADHGYTRPDGRRVCSTCDRIRQRLRAGWPADLAETMPPVAIGQRPVGARYIDARGVGSKPKTACKHGHPLSDDNVYTTPAGHRQCRICIARRVREYTARRADRATHTSTGAP
jgi:hypothetical protein